jgi:hypothetical protein
MAYVKNNWVDREGTTRYFETVDSDGAKIFTPDYTQVTELGTPVNADNMNHIEDGIAAGSFTKYDTKATYALNDLVTVIEDASPAIYKSLQDNNIGNALSDLVYWEKISLGGGGGLEIGDIGFTQMAIDESKGKRRKLNGQLIIQDQYAQLTNIIKASVALNPDLACTEEEWQTAVTMSTNGVCDKFVIDDEGGTIRLPKYPDYFIGGLNGIAPVVGNGKALGMTDGVTNFGLQLSTNTTCLAIDTQSYGTPVGSDAPARGGETGITYGVTTDPANSGIEAHLSNDQAELIKGTYFIQLATGSETEDNITNELELVIPHVLLESKYFETEVYNLSWLRANGSFNGSNAVHPSVYNALLIELNTDIAIGETENNYTKRGLPVKLSTNTYTDEDFVVNIAEETFRLPLVTENRVLVEKKEATTEDPSWYNLYSDGYCEQVISNIVVPKDGSVEVSLLKTMKNTDYVAQVAEYGSTINTSYSGNFTIIKSLESLVVYNNGFANEGHVEQVIICGYVEIPTNENNLYFYVGAVANNAPIVNAGRIEEKLSKIQGDISNLIPNNSNLITSYGTPDYTQGITFVLKDGVTFEAPTNGFVFCANGSASGNRQFTINSVIVFGDTPVYNGATALFPVSKGDIVAWVSGGAFGTQTFYPMKGAN